MKKIPLLISVLFLTAASYGQVALVGWEVTGQNTASHGAAPYSFAATTVGTNISGGALTLGSGVSPNTAANIYGFEADDDVSGSLANSISNNYYFQFTLNAQSGYTFSLSSIEMNGESGGTGANDIALLSSVDGFTDSAIIASVTGAAGKTGGFDTDASGFAGPITLSGAKYETLTSITFRIYGWNMNGGATRLRPLSGDDLVIYGTTAVSAVPEPSTYALMLGIATLGFCWYRRRGVKQAG